jgi:inner membrane transporter RhtA
VQIRRRPDSIPPHAYFVGSAVFHYLGPSFAVLLFARVEPLGVAWLRIATAAAVFAIWRRPWRRLAGLDRSGWLLIGGLGAVFAAMNACFYVAIDRLPLAMVAAVEFLGPVGLALLGARIARNLAAVAAAAVGVYLLTQVRLVGEPVGVAFAFANAALFTAYIVLAHRLSRRGGLGGVDGLGAAMLIAFVLIFPVGLGHAAPAVADPVALAAGVGIGLSSSVIPYVFDQLAMARLPRATYALFVALLPATATAIGVVVLHQLPSAVDLVGIALVMLGVALHRSEATGSAGLTSEGLSDGSDHVLAAGKVRVLQRWAERDRRERRAHSRDRRVELVERGRLHLGRDLGAEAAVCDGLVGDHQPVRSRERLDDRLQVERDERARVDHLDLDALGGELVGGRQRVVNEA